LHLLDLSRSRAREALKIAVSWMVALRILRLGEREEPRWWGTKHFREVCVTPQSLPETPAFIGAIVTVARDGVPKLLELGEFVRRLGGRFSTDYHEFLDEFIYPALIARGLIEQRHELVLWLFPITRRRHTAAGFAEKGRIEAALGQARDIPGLLKSDPARAAALAVGLGSLVLLVEEHRPHYKELQAALAPPDTGGGEIFYYSTGDERPAARHEGQHTEHGEHAGLSPGSSALDLNFNLGSIDMDALGDLGADFGALDAGFDAGGGDGGGGGGD
jgi:hypothetical protein